MPETTGKIIKVSGPLVVASGMQDAKMYEVVRVSEKKLVGEIIELKGDTASIQVYEETSGIGPGEPVYLTGAPLSVELGPGIMENFYDGIERPLSVIAKQVGDYITRGVSAPALDRERKWSFTPSVKAGSAVAEGDVLGTVPETVLVVHKIMVPPGVKGTVAKIAPAGAYTVEEVMAEIQTENDTRQVKMYQTWPIRKPRPVKEKMLPTEPLVTGQRVIDTFFPIAKGGTACAPGPFGAGKTIIQHQLAKWSDADIIVYVGCGERGNEMTDVLTEFPELHDPRTGEPLMKRTTLIANTSNMPVAAREASVYTGITLAEYYRDMGYKVALMADSTSRWAEAMREISGRLEEMPGEEGYPAYLGSKTAAFYERAGYVKCLGSDGREASLSVIGAVSPPGGDLSEPVTQNTLRVTKAFWGLDANLAYRRHYPSIHWLTSYSLYIEQTEEYFKTYAGVDWTELSHRAMEILQKEAELSEIVRLVGLDALSQKEQLVLDTAKSIREDYLQQNAFDEVDSYSSLKKMRLMLKAIFAFQEVVEKRLSENEEAKLSDFTKLPVKEEIARAKSVSENELKRLEELVEKIEAI